MTNRWSRRLHRWGGIVTLVPLAIMAGTGVLLQLKKESAWIQPPTLQGSGDAPAVSFERILDAARSVPEARIDGWRDVDRIDVRPDDGIAKVRGRSRWEVQVDTSTGAVLGAAYRRSDLIESLHDGSFFGNWVKSGLFLPTGVVTLTLIVTGMWLWWMPHSARRRAARRHRSSA